jgi:single-strand DNA-binding protein
MNKIILIGNLTRDPELRTVGSGVSVCDFTIAVNDRRSRNQQSGGQQQETAQFFRVTAWRQLGENCAKYLAKGRKVFVSGPLSARTYQANDGTTRVSLEVTAEDVEFLTSRAESEGMGYAPAAAAPVSSAVTAQNDGFTQVNDDDLPF